MALTLLPAVDVADGRAVRLVQGEAGAETTYGDPRDVALAWQAGGAEWIHLVDLDAAFGARSNAALLAAVIGELDVEVELSGGIRNDASLERALSTGCARVNLATAALEDPAWCARVIAAYGEPIAVGLDVRVGEHPDGSVQHQLAARGGACDGGDLWATLAWLEGDGCARYVVTDVSKDGMLRGPNMALYRAVTGATAAPVIASGGGSPRSETWSRWPRLPRRVRTWRGPLSARRSAPAGSPCPMRSRPGGRSTPSAVDTSVGQQHQVAIGLVDHTEPMRKGTAGHVARRRSCSECVSGRVPVCRLRLSLLPRAATDAGAATAPLASWVRVPGGPPQVGVTRLRGTPRLSWPRGVVTGVKRWGGVRKCVA